MSYQLTLLDGFDRQQLTVDDRQQVLWLIKRCCSQMGDPHSASLSSDNATLEISWVRHRALVTCLTVENLALMPENTPFRANAPY